MGTLTAEPVRHYERPPYPTKEEAVAATELLAQQVPSADISREEISRATLPADQPHIQPNPEHRVANVYTPVGRTPSAALA